MKTKCEYSGTLFIISRKYFSVFRGPHIPLESRYTILDSMFPPCNAISEGRLPLCSTSSDAGALPSDAGALPSELQLDFLISVSRGRCGLRKTEKIFSANNEQGTIIRGKKVVSRKTLKKIDLENFKPLYTNKKVQLQLDFLISPAVDGLFY